jgi:hypothetical protein
VSPILGILASSAFPQVGDFESIQTVTVGAVPAASISFTSIPSTYKHLQIRAISRDNRPSTWIDSCYISFNGDTTGGNYYYHQIVGDGTSANSYNGAGATGFGVPNGLTSATNVTSSFSANVIDILDYANTNKNKTLRTLVGIENNTSGTIRLMSALWLNTAAITSITIVNDGGSVPANALFQQYTSFALYGIK